MSASQKCRKKKKKAEDRNVIDQREIQTKLMTAFKLYWKLTNERPTWCQPAKRKPPNTNRNQSSSTQRTENKTTDVVIHQHSRKLLKMDILMSETCWAHKKWNKTASDIKLVFHLSTIAMMHGPINIRCQRIFRSQKVKEISWLAGWLLSYSEEVSVPRSFKGNIFSIVSVT